MTNDFARSLRAEMKHANDTQDDLVKKSGVTQSSISKILQGRNPSYKSLMALLRVYPALLRTLDSEARKAS